MHFPIGITLLYALSSVFAIPVPTRKAGELVKFKAKHSNPVHHMGNQAGLNNNHHGIVLGKEPNGHLRVTHVSSNPPPPKIHIDSVVHPGSVGLTGKVHVGHSTINPVDVKDSRFTGQHLTPEQVGKIKLAGKVHAVVGEAAQAAQRKSAPPPRRN